MDRNRSGEKEGYQNSVPRRIVLYSHDTCGLGHLRRNLLIARSIRQAYKHVNILLLSGAREAASYALPRGVDLFSLPAYEKVDNENYEPRFLDLALDQFRSLRSDTICTILQTFEPDLFIVDKVPRGTLGELEASLHYLKHESDCRCVLGLRDILDDPLHVRVEWTAAGNFAAIKEYYDAVWVYGDPVVYSPEIEYNFPVDIREKIVYTGYLGLQNDSDDAACVEGDNPVYTEKPFALCAVGGGKDGYALAEAFVQSTFPEDLNGVLLTGPHMPAEQRLKLSAICEKNPHLQLLEFHQKPIALYRRADRIVCMGGYNTLMEILSLSKKPLVAPRIHPRIEQLLRVQRFERLGLVEHLNAKKSMPGQISSWLHRKTEAIHPEKKIDMKGLSRLLSLISLPVSVQEASYITQSVEAS